MLFKQKKGHLTLKKSISTPFCIVNVNEIGHNSHAEKKEKMIK